MRARLAYVWRRSWIVSGARPVFLRALFQWVCLRQLFDLRKPPFGDVIACSLVERFSIRGFSASMTIRGVGRFGRLREFSAARR